MLSSCAFICAVTIFFTPFSHSVPSHSIIILHYHSAWSLYSFITLSHVYAISLYAGSARGGAEVAVACDLL